MSIDVLVNLAPVLDDSFLLEFVAGLMIEWQFLNNFASAAAHYGPTISHVGDVALLPVEESDQTAWSWLVDLAHVGLVKERFFTFLEAHPDGLLHFVGKTKFRKRYLFSLEMKLWRLSLRKSAQSTPPWPSNTPKYAAFFQSTQCSGLLIFRMIATRS